MPIRYRSSMQYVFNQTHRNHPNFQLKGVEGGQKKLFVVTRYLKDRDQFDFFSNSSFTNSLKISETCSRDDGWWLH